MKTKRWSIKSSADSDTVSSLARDLNVSSILANLLAQRGIRTFEEARHFFRPSIENLHDPFLMKDMDKAIDRIEQAILNQERILVFGDYDVDGTTAVSLVYSFFRKFYDKLDYYLPDRYKEGYGISLKGIEYAAEHGYSLIIALDCGIKAVEKVDIAKEKGIDFIICDHHRPGDVIPRAVAVLDQKRDDCPYPYKELSGCGIGFKLVQAYALRHDMPFSELEEYLDLVAVSTAADIVPITGENRVLVYYGLNWLNKHPRPGIKAILELAQVNRELTVNDVVFVIGPRINAAGRIQDARQAVDLLISANSIDALAGGKNIDEKNTGRRTLDTEITEQALTLAEQDARFALRKSTVLYHPKWHKGVIGIVASRLTDRFYRPTIILTESNGYITGSARSVKDFDIYNAIESCSDLLEQFGGHMYAAGLTMKPENVEKFAERFEEVVATTIEDRMLVQEVEIDSEISLSEVTPSFYNVLKQFAPFGPGNLSPVFCARNVRDTGSSRIVGNNHLKLNIAQDETTRFGFDAIGFQLGDFHPLISRKIPFDIAFTIEENTWNNRTTLQLNIKDIKVS